MSTTIFWQTNHPKRIRWALVTWIIIAALLFFFPKIAGAYESSTLLFLLYCLLGFIALSYGIKQSLSLRSIFSFILFCGILYGIVSISPLLWAPSILLYYSIVAWSEELMKYFSWISFSSFSLLQSDAIIRAILLALWFSFLENIIYALPVLDSLGQAWSVIINRWATGYLMHSIFTGTIAYLAIKRSKKSLIDRWTLWALGVWVGLHLFYNLIVSQHIARLLIPLLIWGYGLLSYLLYASDSVYLKEFS